MMTTNGGATWAAGAVAPAAGLSFSSLDAVSGTTAWAAMIDETAGGGQVYRTTNGGATWTRQLATGFPAAAGGFLNAVRMLTATTGVAMGDPLTTTTEFEVYVTANAGATWTAVPGTALPNPLAGEYGFQKLITTQGTTNVWFGTNKGRVYRSINAGSSWAVATTGLASISRLAFSSATHGLAMNVDTDGTLLGLVRTTDGGATWTRITAPSGPVLTGDLQAVPGAPLTYVASNANPNGPSLGSALTTDGGSTWTDLETGQQRTAIGAADANTVWAGAFTDATTGLGGIWKGSLPSQPTPSTLNWTWARQAGSVLGDYAADVTTDAAGNVYAVGNYQGSITLGTTTLSSAGGYDIYLVKYNAQGVVQWARSAGGVNNDFASAVVVNPITNAPVVTGGFATRAVFGSLVAVGAGDFDVFVVQYSATGTAQWLTLATGTGADFGNGLAADASGNLYVAGEFTGTLTVGAARMLTSSGGSDALLFSLTSAGAVRWAQAAGGTLDDIGTGVAATDPAIGRVYLTGQFQDEAVFDNGFTTAAPTSSWLPTTRAAARRSGRAVWAASTPTAATASAPTRPATPTWRATSRAPRPSAPRRSRAWPIRPTCCSSHTPAPAHRSGRAPAAAPAPTRGIWWK